MCLSPLLIKNKSSYFTSVLCPERYSVPCGKCLECRDFLQSEWVTRLSFEINDLKKRGGECVLLTFTYNDNCLPHLPSCYLEPFEKDCLCFNMSDVRTFLNRLKIRSYRSWGPNSYKYFFCSEYGKNTCRPHYHGIFFLSPLVPFHDFCELCRELWKFGFMFPKYDYRRCTYVDSKNRPCFPPTVRSSKNSAVYMSKYVTKDLSFYELPPISRIQGNRELRKICKDYLPRHYQSNGLGSCIINHIDFTNRSSVSDVLTKGITNPLTMKVVSLPLFVTNKLLYRYVLSDRISPTTGRLLYDRVLTDFGRNYMYCIFLSRVRNTASKMRDFVSSYRFNDDFLSFFPESDSRFRYFNYIVPSVSSDDCQRAAIFHELFAHSSPTRLKFYFSRFDGSLTDFWNIDNCYELWLASKDTYYLRELKRYCYASVYSSDDPWPVCPVGPNPLLSEISLYSVFDLFYRNYSSFKRKLSLDERHAKMDYFDKLHREFTSVFDKTLC